MPRVQHRSDAVLVRSEAQLRKPGGPGLGERFVAQLTERRPAPERQRFIRLPLGDEPLEPRRIQLLRLDSEQVPGPAGHHP